MADATIFVTAAQNLVAQQRQFALEALIAAAQTAIAGGVPMVLNGATSQAAYKALAGHDIHNDGTVSTVAVVG